MPAGIRRPWLWSLGLHAVAVSLVAAVLAGQAGPPPQPVTIRFVVSGPAARATGLPTASWWTPARAAVAAPASPVAPEWRTTAVTPAAEAPLVPAPVSLDELLVAQSAPSAAAPQAARGWSNASGEGYAAPPLPPPGFTPPQGARWNLVLTVGAGGGLATSIDGLDSGHPELDAWLEAYLRTVAFPASLDGSESRFLWHLTLNAGKPQ